MKSNNNIEVKFNTIAVLNTNVKETNNTNIEKDKNDVDSNQLDPKHDTETTKHKALNNLHQIESERKAANTYRTPYFPPIPIAYLQGSHKDKYEQSYK